MKIGLTYDLRQEYLEMGYSEPETAELDSVETIDAIERALGELGHRPVRIGHARALMKALVKGERWDLVFNIAEGIRGLGREAQVPAILDVYDIPYTFSDPVVMGLCLNKALTKQIIRDAGLATARFAVVHNGALNGSIPFVPPFFAKPVAEGTGMGITEKSMIQDSRELARTCRDLIRQFRQPVLVEQFLPGREFTVGITGTGQEARVMGTMEIVLTGAAQGQAYSLENKENWKDRVTFRPMTAKEDPLIREVETLAFESWNVLGCRDGGRIDIRCDGQGKPNFIEVNPLAGLRPEYSDLPILCEYFGTSYVRLIECILNSAFRRMENGVGR